MKTVNKLFFTLFVALMVSICAADDQQVINQLCRFRIATIPHPNPALCHLYVQCVVSFKYKFWIFEIAKINYAVNQWGGSGMSNRKYFCRE